MLITTLSAIVSQVVMCCLLYGGPDITSIEYDDFEFHPTLGVIISIDGYQVAYPVYSAHRTTECVWVVEVQHHRYVVCSEGLEYTLGEPTAFQYPPHYGWLSMDYWGVGELKYPRYEFKP